MDAPSPSSAPAYSDFLEQAKIAQAALKSMLSVLEQPICDRDEDVVKLVINKAIKATVRHSSAQFIFLLLTFSSFISIILQRSSRIRFFKKFRPPFEKPSMNYMLITPTSKFQRTSARLSGCTLVALTNSQHPRLIPRKVCFLY